MNALVMALLLAANLWMTWSGFRYGTRFIRRHQNHLLGIEWLVIGMSGTNVLFLAATGINHSSFSYHLMVFFDAFSRSFGMTVVIVLGMMAVTHGYRASRAIEAVVFACAVAVGLWRALDVRPVSMGWAIFYLVLNLATAVFMVTVAMKLWRIGERRQGFWVGLATAAGAGIAIIYDFFPIPGDDAEHSLFYLLALSAWALMLTTYYHGYRILDDSRRAQVGSRAPDPPVSTESARVE